MFVQISGEFLSAARAVAEENPDLPIEFIQEILINLKKHPNRKSLTLLKGLLSVHRPRQ